jgi:pyruvate kinase
MALRTHTVVNMNSDYKEAIGRMRTKIVATLGPASSNAPVLGRMVDAGADVFRLNFSHGTHAEHTAALDLIRRIGREKGVQLAVLQDLCGPKIRLGTIPGGVVVCDLDSEFMLLSEPGGSDDPHCLTSTHRELADDLEPGQSVLFADGTVAMDVVDRGPGRARLKVTLPGQIRSHQGINVPGAGLSVATLTEKDLADLDWTKNHDLAYVGLSFVRTAEDIRRLREELDRRGSRAKIIAKIEKPQAVRNLEAIVAETDAVMIARGDLGVELDVIRVPEIQKHIIETCRRCRVPVITATQMLASMELSSRPTRAEASDVYNAVVDGTDAVMLSGETAIGSYPVESVAMMSRIVGEAERRLFEKRRAPAVISGPQPGCPDPEGNAAASIPVARAGRVRPITDSVVAAACLIADQLDAALIVVETHSGRTATALSNQRGRAMVLALANDVHTVRSMSLLWGVVSEPMPELSGPAELREFVVKWGRDRGLIEPGARIVLIRGTDPTDATHNELEVYEAP